MTSRQAELIGWEMSACSLARPSASRVARSSSSLPPHWLQNRPRRWFLQPHDGQRSVSLRLGMATKEPFVPSIIFRSRTTNASSNVTEQKACRRSLLSSMSLMRTSVISTVVLLLVCGLVRVAFPILRNRAFPHSLEEAAPLGTAPDPLDSELL